MNKKSKSLILLFILLNINNRNSVLSEKEKLSQFIKEQTEKKYFVPIAMTTFFTLGMLPHIIINRSKLTNLTEIKKSLASISKKDFALTGLKSLFVASSLKKEFYSEETFNGYLQKISLLSLLGVYTHKTIADLLKKEEQQTLGTLFEKILENFGTIGVVDTAIKGMHNNDKPLLKPSEISFIENKEKQAYTYYGLLITLMCLWKYSTQKNITSPTNLGKTFTDILVVYGLTHAFTKSEINDYTKKLLILLVFFNGIREFYKNSQSRSLEKELTKSISLEDITANMGKQLALTSAFNQFIDFFNANLFPKEDKTEKEATTTKE